MGSFESNVADRFQPGSKLDVVPRLGDAFSPSVAPVKSVTVGDDGGVKVDGLIDNAPYWLSDGERATAFTAKTKALLDSDVNERASRSATNDQVLAEREGRAKLHRSELASAAPGRATTPNVITGARSSKAHRGVPAEVLEQVQPVVREQIEDRDPVEPNPRPAPNQLDVSGVVQRSDTPFGEATPKDVGEPQPRPSQDQVKKGTVQRSDTPLGEATPKDKSEVAPALDQDDAPKGLVQKSDTPEGSVEPVESQTKRKGKSAVKSATEAKRLRESSMAKASGEDVKPAAKTSRKAASPAGRVKKVARKDA